MCLGGTQLSHLLALSAGTYPDVVWSFPKTGMEVPLSKAIIPVDVDNSPIFLGTTPAASGYIECDAATVLLRQG